MSLLFSLSFLFLLIFSNFTEYIPHPWKWHATNYQVLIFNHINEFVISRVFSGASFSCFKYFFIIFSTPSKTSFVENIKLLVGGSQAQWVSIEVMEAGLCKGM